jgi:hypothetical protein
LLPSGLGVDDAAGAVPLDGGEVEVGQLVVFGPSHEVPGLEAAVGLFVGQPVVEITLAGALEGEVVGGKPVQQCDGGPDLLLYGAGLAVGGGPVVVAGPEPA